jgi:hypothetical protein
MPSPCTQFAAAEALMRGSFLPLLDRHNVSPPLLLGGTRAAIGARAATPAGPALAAAHSSRATLLHAACCTQVPCDAHIIIAPDSADAIAAAILQQAQRLGACMIVAAPHSKGRLQVGGWRRRRHGASCGCLRARTICARGAAASH